jgi:hypothetical protein
MIAKNLLIKTVRNPYCVRDLCLSLHRAAHTHLYKNFKTYKRRHCGLDPQSPEKRDSDFRQNDEQERRPALRTPSQNFRDTVLSIRTASHNLRDTVLHSRTASQNLRDTVLSIRTPSHNLRDTVLSIRTPSQNLRDTVLSIRTPSHNLRGAVLSIRTPSHNLRGAVLNSGRLFRNFYIYQYTLLLIKKVNYEINRSSASALLS